MLANLRYWTTVCSLVLVQLNRYKRHANTIPDPLLREMALDKLDDQGFHAQMAATLATLAPRRYRRHAIRAIVASEVIYDYFDALTEQLVPDPINSGLLLFSALSDALYPERPPRNYYALYPRSRDGGYLQALIEDIQQGVNRLPSIEAIRETAERSVRRFGEAQVRAHAVTALGDSQFKEWASREAADTTLGWFEYFAGATSSIVGYHALIAAAAVPDTRNRDADHIDMTYLYIGVIITVLDSLIDYERDIASTGEQGYTRYYDDPGEIPAQLTHAARQAIAHARETPDEAHHVMTLAGVVAFYTSAPSATRGPAKPIAEQLQHMLQPLMTPTLAVMRAWRTAKAIRN